MTATGAGAAADSAANSAPHGAGLAGLLVDVRRSVETWASAAVGAGATSGRDESGAVAVEVDGTGRVARVVVAEDWRQLLGTTEATDAPSDALSDARGVGVDLGSAVVAAAAAANVARLARWAVALSRAAVSATDAVGPTSDAVVAARPVATRSADGSVKAAMPANVHRCIAELADLTLRVWDEVDSIANPRRSLNTPVRARESVTGGGFVEVAVVAAHLASVRTAHLRPNAPGRYIGAAMTCALSSAYAEWDRMFPDPRTLRAAAELRSRVADPAVFLASLGLAAPSHTEVGPRVHQRLADE
jgi:hypothetical protein